MKRVTCPFKLCNRNSLIITFALLLKTRGEIKQLALLNSSSVHAPGVEQLIDKPKEESLALEVGELQLIKHLPKFLI